MPSFRYKPKYTYSIKKVRNPRKSKSRKSESRKSRRRQPLLTHNRSNRFRTINSNKSTGNRTMLRTTFHRKIDRLTDNKYSRIFKQTSRELREIILEHITTAKEQDIPIDFFDRVLENFLKKNDMYDLDPKYKDYKYLVDYILHILRDHKFIYWGRNLKISSNLIKNLHFLNVYVSSSTSEVDKPLTVIEENKSF